MKLISLSIPEYTVDSAPEYKKLGKVIDDEIKKNFMGHSILLRGVGSQQHPDKTVDELIDIVQNAGTDRYDKELSGDRYDNIEKKHIDLFAFPASVTKDLELSWQVFYGFYHSEMGYHGTATRIDILTVYDATLLEEVVHQYEGQDDIKHDGFAFKNPKQKAKAVIGIIKIT